MTKRIESRWSVFALGLLCACTSTAATQSLPSTAVEWKAVVCHRTAGVVERIRIGRPDASDPRLQAVCVDKAGDVALVHFEDRGPRSEILYRNGTELTGLVMGNVDPTIDGPELYVGGYLPGKSGEENGGAVFQIVITNDPNERVRVRRIWSGTAYVHAIECIEPIVTHEGRRLLVSTYAGELIALTCIEGQTEWKAVRLHAEPPSTDIEANKIKDVGFLRDAQGRPTRVALVVFKTGRMLRIDIDHPETARIVHEETGGLSRVTPDPTGGAYVTGYFGRLLHFTPDGDELKLAVLDQEGVDSGLRGAVLGTFPVEGAVAHFAVFGFHKLCRVLVPRHGVLDPVTLHVDTDRGHTLDAADLVPGNGADEILIGGYSQAVTMLVR